MKFCFESHEKTPLDQYVKEIVTFKFYDEHEIFYVPFFRKQSKDGGLFWASASVGIQKGERKEFVDGFQLDSRSRLKSILAFLEERRWETQSLQQPTKETVQWSIDRQHANIKPEASVFEPELPF